MDMFHKRHKNKHTQGITMLTHKDIKEKVDQLSEHLTYPELDDLHAIYDYVCELEQTIE